MKNDVINETGLAHALRSQHELQLVFPLLCQTLHLHELLFYFGLNPLHVVFRNRLGLCYAHN